MNLAALLIITLSNQGYWFGGGPATVTVQPAIKAPLAADVMWELRLDNLRLDQGTTPVSSGDEPTAIRLTTPKVRVRVMCHLLYRVLAHDTKKELEAGDVPVFIFPDDLTHGYSSRLGHRRLVICDKPSGLPQLLDKAGIAYTGFAGVEKLEFARADDIVMVGQDVLVDSLFEQAPLMNLAKAGASVMIFRQSEPGRLMEYPLADRTAPASLDWRMDHPLLAGFDRGDLPRWIRPAASIRVVQLPPNEPALPIGFYPPEAAGGEPAPVDAVLITRTVGKGRFVLCQLPLGDWMTDPRSQMLLGNAMEYLATRPQPTPTHSAPPGTGAAEKSRGTAGRILRGGEL